MNAAQPRVDEGPPSLTLDGAVATIRLRRPAQRNSLHGVDLQTLLRFFSQLDADPAVRVVVLSAATDGQPRPVFSAGYNIVGFESGAHDPMLFERVAEALARLRPITVCA
ncbi:MAG: enoyl-CoA hydratase/isomerase family protein, partial [Burkholderiaceae bacterium]